MSDMVRKQIYISRRQQALVKRLAQLRGLSEAEIIRQAIDHEATRVKAQIPAASEQSWQEAVVFMRSLRQRVDKSTEPIQWDREELYEQRLSRFTPKSGDEDIP